MPFWVKPVQMDMGCSLVWVAHVILGRTSSNRYGLLMLFWVKPLQMDMGCSLVLVAHAYLGQTITNEHGLLISVGCSHENVNIHF